MPDPDVRANSPATVVPGEAPGGDLAALVNSLLTVGEETTPRKYVAGNIAGPTSTDLRLSYFTARKSEAITQVRTYVGSTAAAATPTLCRIGIWTAGLDGALLALVGSTANDVALWSVVGLEYTTPLQTPWAKVAGQRYAWAPLIVTAGARPTFAGHTIASDGGGFRTESGRSPRITAVSAGNADLPTAVAVGGLGTSGIFYYASFVP